MAKMKFGATEEEVVTREEFPMEKAKEVLKDETIAKNGKKQCNTVGNPAKLFLKLKKPPNAAPLFNTFFQTRVKFRRGLSLSPFSRREKPCIFHTVLA